MVAKIQIEMHRIRVSSTILSLLCVALYLFNGCQSTPLDDYVHADDPHFGWTIIQTYDEQDYKLYVLNFTSQKWYDGKYIDV